MNQALLHQPALSLAPQMAGEVTPVEEVTGVARPSPLPDRPAATGSTSIRSGVSSTKTLLYSAVIYIYIDIYGYIENSAA